MQLVTKNALSRGYFLSESVEQDRRTELEPYIQELAGSKEAYKKALAVLLNYVAQERIACFYTSKAMIERTARDFYGRPFNLDGESYKMLGKEMANGPLFCSVVYTVKNKGLATLVRVNNSTLRKYVHVTEAEISYVTGLVAKQLRQAGPAAQSKCLVNITLDSVIEACFKGIEVRS